MITPVLDTTEFDCIIANNDAMALGAVEAMIDVGQDPASVPIVGIDASTDGRKSIAEGQMAASAFQNAIGQEKLPYWQQRTCWKERLPTKEANTA